MNEAIQTLLDNRWPLLCAAGAGFNLGIIIVAVRVIA